MEMFIILLKHQLEPVNHLIQPLLLRLIKQKHRINDLMRILDITGVELVADIESIIKAGHPVLKEDLKAFLNIETEDFNTICQIVSQQDPNTSNSLSEIINRLQAEYANLRDRHMYISIIYSTRIGLFSSSISFESIERSIYRF